MARSGSDFRGWYWWALVVTSVLVPFVAIAAVVFLISQGRENADQWASIFSFVITGLVAAAAMIGWLRQRAKSRGDLGTLDVAEPEADAVAACAERLAAGVERAWRTEELRQRLLDPEPMPVAWRTLGPPVTDHWRVIGGGDTPIDLDGSLNDSYDVVRTRLPKGRLVVLGEPGGGKTSLMVRFVLDALAAREPSDPVPVILRLSTWEPSEQPISSWIYARLKKDYDHVCSEPLPLDRLLLILDGLDEMPAHARKQALAQINAAFSARHPLVLTSRTAEYLDTIESERADVLTAAAAIELKPLDATAVRDYLTITTKPARLPAWSNVFAELAARPDGELARGLSTPLALSLARVAYAEQGEDPDELLTFTTRHEIETHLLAGLVPALYPGANEPDQPGWHPGFAASWLSFLARHFGRQPISVPGLIDAVPTWLYGVVLSLLSGLCAGAAFGAAAGSASGALVGTVMAVVTFAGLAVPSSEPLPGGGPLPFLAGTGFFAVLLALLTNAAGLSAGQAAVIAAGAALWLQAILSRGIRAVQVALLDLAVVHAAVTRPSVSPYALILAFIVTYLAVSVLSASSLRLLLARALLAVSGRLPWRVGAFLEDGHRRGVLRQVGGFYYFRHDLLRRQLAHEEW